MTSLAGRKAPASAWDATLPGESIGKAVAHLAMHVAISGQLFWQSGMAGVPSGQHGMSSAISPPAAIADMETSFIVATVSAFTGAVNGPAMSPMIARIGSSLRSQVTTNMEAKMSQTPHSGKSPLYPAG